VRKSHPKLLHTRKLLLYVTSTTLHRNNLVIYVTSWTIVTFIFGVACYHQWIRILFAYRVCLSNELCEKQIHVSCETMGSEVSQYLWRSVVHITWATMPLDAQFPREAIGISSTSTQAITYLYNAYAWKVFSMERRVKRLTPRWIDERSRSGHALTRGLHLRDFVSWHRIVARKSLRSGRCAYYPAITISW